MKALLLISALLTLATPSPGQSRQQEIDNMMQYAGVHGYFNGSIAVMEGDSLLYNRSFGFANYRTKTANSKSSIYELGSIAKQFTAMAVMMLQEKGKLGYGDSLRQYFPELPYHNITIRHLLHHTSGLPDYLNEMGFMYWDAERIYTNNDAIKDLAKHKLPVHFLPGERFEYCNTGYMLLASIVEKVSGTSFQDFLEKKIFHPLGMTNTGIFSRYGSGKEKNATLAPGFVYDLATNSFELPENLPELRIVRAFGGVVGDGGIGSSIDDQIKWQQALFSNTLVTDASMQLALSPGKLNNGTSTGYGFGWFIQQDPTDGAMIQHTGGWPGVRNAVVRWLEKGRVLIVLRNNEIDFRGIQDAVKNILNDKPYTMPKPSMAQALAFVAANDNPEAIRARYKALMPGKAIVSEEQVNQLGLALLAAKKTRSGTEVLRINCELFPQSWTAFDNLGAAYLKAGDKENAKRNYLKSLELNPTNSGAKKALEQLNN